MQLNITKSIVYVESSVISYLVSRPSRDIVFAHQRNWEGQPMIKDPIVDEIRQHRKEHAKKYGNDLKRIVEALRKRECKSKRKLLNPGPKIKLKNNEQSLSLT
ncbi:hypothetical protein GMMP15_750043 [Candidatus Magnetomoraceae bacterium gMMP-15]